MIGQKITGIKKQIYSMKECFEIDFVDILKTKQRKEQKTKKNVYVHFF